VRTVGIDRHDEQFATCHLERDLEARATGKGELAPGSWGAHGEQRGGDPFGDGVEQGDAFGAHGQTE